jgi:hypothetical protein
MTYEETEDEAENPFENAVRDYFVALRWHERALQNVQNAQAEVGRALESKKKSRQNLELYVENADEVSCVCAALLDPL